MNNLFLLSTLLSCFVVSACAPQAQYPPARDAGYATAAKTKLQKPTASTAERMRPKTRSASKQLSRHVRSVDQAFERIVEAHPSFLSYLALIKAAEADVSQAGLLPNPELEAEIEEIGGDAAGFSDSETSIAIVQPLLLGGKLSARVQLALHENQVQKLEAAHALASVFSEAKAAYANLLYAYSALSLAQEQLLLAKEVVAAAKRKLEAGAILAVESTKAEIALANAKLSKTKSKSQLLIARQQLSAFWAGAPDDLGTEAFEALYEDYQNLLAPVDLRDSPIYLLSEAKLELSAARLDAAQRRAVPDARIGLGYKRLEESQTNAFLAVFSVDLPLFDRNQGTIQHATEKLTMARLEEKVSLLDITRKVNALQSHLRVLLQERHSLTTSILPHAHRVYEQTKNAYSRGRSSYADLLDAQQVLLQAKFRVADIALVLNQTAIELEQASGVTMKQVFEVMK